MKKRIFLCLLCLAMAGCGRASAIPQTTRQATEEQDGNEIGNTAETQDTEADSDGEEAVQYPIVATPSTDGWIDTVLVSEGSYCIFDGEKYGFMTEDGEEIAPYIYDIAYPFHDGLACVSCDGKFGFIDVNGDTVLPFIYDRATPFMEGLAYFSIGDEYGFMDESGTVVFYLDCDSVSSFKEGLAYFSIDGRYGYIDRTGETVIEPVYDDAGYFQNGFTKVMQDGRYGIIDRDGTEILAPAYDNIRIEGSFLITQSEDTYDCFDSNGKKLLEACECIWVNEGYLCFEREEKWGVADENGNILLEPCYSDVSLVGEKELAIVKEGDYYGIVDFSNEIKLPFAYSWISYDDGVEGGVFCVLLDGKTGCLDASDFSERIPFIYDSIELFVDNRAVVTLDGQAGIVNEYGELVLPIAYDSIRILEDGKILQEKDSEFGLYDSNGELLKKDTYDSIWKEGNFYEVVIDGKYGFLNEKGEVAIPVVYDYVTEYEVYGSSDVHILTQYNANVREIILRTGDSGDYDISDVLLKNEITPRAGKYLEFVQGASVQVKDGDGYRLAEQENLNGFQKTYKLYDVNHSGDPVLYFYAEPYYFIGFPLSYSGFYGICDKQLVELVSGYECGGSLRGDYVCLWYDRENEEVLLGRAGAWGGFGGSAYEREVFTYDGKELLTEISFETVWQTAGNYTEEELLTNAELFYDGMNEPYTKETIVEAETVTEYSVNGVQTTVEDYNKAADRYLYRGFLK
ncbi:MAG: WG repeat-containing protein [Lachnospiraceae bacterium]